MLQRRLHSFRAEQLFLAGDPGRFIDKWRKGAHSHIDGIVQNLPHLSFRPPVVWRLSSPHAGVPFWLFLNCSTMGRWRHRLDIMSVSPSSHCSATCLAVGSL